MGIFDRSMYSRSASTDLETAISNAVERVLDRDFPGPGGVGTIRLEEFFTDWADLNDQFVSPSAAVLPDEELKYGPSQTTPHALEDTWEPRGEPGFCLMEIQEASREFEIVVRAAEVEQRNALKGGIETAFQDPRGLLVVAGEGQAGTARLAPGDRAGVVVAEMPEYWRLPCRLTLLASRKLDDADSSARHVYEARFRLRAEASLVMLQPMQPMRVRITSQVVDSIPGR